MSPRAAVVFAAMAAANCPAARRAAAQSGPPEMTSLRYDESYSYLSNETLRGGSWWEPLKYQGLGGTDSEYLSFGAEIRARYEAYENDGWSGAAAADHDYVWLRALPYVDVHVGEWFRGFVQLISAVELGDEAGTSPVDENRADLLQGFVDLGIARKDRNATLRIGRQEVALGSERLISVRYGPNVPRSFDAARGSIEAGAWSLDLLWGRPVANDEGSFDDTVDRHQGVWAAYGTCKLDAKCGVDLYYIGVRADAAEYDQGRGRETRHSGGSRFFGRWKTWDWNFEAIGQTGSFDGGRIRAWSVASDTGYTLDGIAFQPRVGLKANIISGDRDASDRDLETFNPLFPNGKYFGEIGLLGPYNLVNLHPSVDLALDEAWSLGFASVFYWRESAGDGIYDNGGSLLRSNRGSDERYIGTQWDVVVGYAPLRTFDVTVSYSEFIPGAYIRDTGTDEVVHFVSVEARFRF